ncbi:MAG: penicillin-binding transpeptidase domain-containing protein [Sandaracinaceae bacterium]
MLASKSDTRSSDERSEEFPDHDQLAGYAQMSTTPEGELVLEMLRLAVTEDGTGSAAKVEGLEVLGKTGTSRLDDVQGAVFVGRVGDGDTSTWIGVSVHGVASDAYGGSVSAPAFAHIVETALR